MRSFVHHTIETFARKEPLGNRRLDLHGQQRSRRFGLAVTGNDAAFGGHLREFVPDLRRDFELRTERPESGVARLQFRTMPVETAQYQFVYNPLPHQRRPVIGNADRIGRHTDIGTDSAITALITVNDTSAQTLDTVHGQVEFIQFVGITETELNKIREDLDNLPILIGNMKKENPELITDMKRKKSYL